jgi:LacI family transcriptional regulator
MLKISDLLNNKHRAIGTPKGRSRTRNARRAQNHASKHPNLERTLKATSLDQKPQIRFASPWFDFAVKKIRHPGFAFTYPLERLNPFNREGSRSCAKTDIITCQSTEFIRFAILWIDFAVKKSGFRSFASFRVFRGHPPAFDYPKYLFAISTKTAPDREMSTPSSNNSADSPRAVTLADVAARAGVAVSTVSRVVNGSHLVTAEKKNAIELIIKEMGYEPAPLEKRKGVRRNLEPWLKHRLIKTILFGPHDLLWITNYATVYFYALHGAEEALRDLDFQHSTERAETPTQLIELLNEGGADGFLILNTGNTPLPPEVSDFPVVTFMGSQEGLTCDRVTPDPERAGVLAAQYLQSKGCKRCVAIGRVSEIFRRRMQAFAQTLEAAGIPCTTVADPTIIQGGPGMHQVNRPAIAAALAPLLAQPELPLGVFSVADIMTPVIYGELQRAGMKLDEQAFVVSCNGERPYLDALHPAPAVIDIQANYVGRRAVRQLMSRLEAPKTPREKVLISPQLLPPGAE